MLKNNTILFVVFKSDLFLPGDADTIQTPSSVSASSVKYLSSYNYADLTKYPTKTWQAGQNNNYQYVIFYYPQQFYIVAIEVKGDGGYYVKSFYIQYYDDMANNFINYKVRLCRN